MTPQGYSVSVEHPAFSRIPGLKRSARLWRSRAILALALILVAGAALRLYGVDWDGGHWLHPDERKIYFVVDGLRLPDSLAQALSADSPLNPKFFAYGSLPIYLLKLIAWMVGAFSPSLGDPDNLHRIARPLAALLDLATVVLTYRLALVLGRLPSALPPAGPTQATGDRQPGATPARLRASALTAAALVGLAVLPVQLAHFYTADILLTCLVMLTLNLAADVACGAGWRRQVALGVALGLALATKLIAAPLILVVLTAWYLRKVQHAAGGSDSACRTAGCVVIALATAGVVFLLVQPYVLIDWRTFLTDTLRESQIAWGRLDVPYTRQYAGTLPYLYSFWQTSVWGLGLPLGVMAWAGFAATLIRWLRRGSYSDTLLLAWAVPYAAIVGLLYTRYLRYMLPMVPVLCIMAVSLFDRVGARRVRTSDCQQAGPGRAGTRQWRTGGKIAIIGRWSLAILSLFYVLTFVSIYGPPHPWITASEWIYRTVPAGSTLAVEDWDTPLPLPLEVDGQARRIEDYALRTLTLYDEPDGVAKWSRLAADLAASDTLIVASQRLYGSIPRMPERYPIATRYYELLFAGELGFELAAEFTRGPDWLNPRLPPQAGAAPALLRPDESFVVYDHPRTLVFRNAEHLPAQELLRRLGTP